MRIGTLNGNLRTGYLDWDFLKYLLLVGEVGVGGGIGILIHGKEWVG